MPTKNSKSVVRKVPPITIENAHLIYKNFGGVAKQFNAKGLRNFNVLLDLDLARILEQDGWNVKWDDPKEEGDLPRARLKVAVRFDNYPPRVVLITRKGKSVLGEDSIDILDWAEIERADVVLTASPWDVNGKQGIKAYLKKAFITLSEDDLEAKYSGVSSAGQNTDEDDD